MHLNEDEPVVTAKQYMAYKKEKGRFKEFYAPETVLVCYQNSLLPYFLEKYPDIRPCTEFSNFYYINNGKIGILIGWGFGAPALVTKLEQMIVMGVKRFIAIGLAGSLEENHQIGDFVISKKALAEDGVSHLYLPPNTPFALADSDLFAKWEEFAINQNLPKFHNIPTWSFPAIFRETPRAIRRVRALGCGVVEMEAATLYALGQDKGVSTLSLFVVSDLITETTWKPQLQEVSVRLNLEKLSDYTLRFIRDAYEN